MNQESMLKLAYQYGVLQALAEAGIIKEGQGITSIDEMKSQAYRGQRLGQQGLPTTLPSKTTSPIKMPKPQQTAQPAVPTPRPAPPQKAPVQAKPPTAKAPSNLLTRAPGAIQRRRQMLNKYR